MYSVGGKPLTSANTIRRVGVYDDLRLHTSPCSLHKAYNYTVYQVIMYIT